MKGICSLKEMSNAKAVTHNNTGNHKNVMLSEKIWTEKKKYKQYLCNLYDILSLMVERKPAVA